MFARTTLAVLVVALGIMPAWGQEKPALLVHAFQPASGVKWPYEPKLLQAELIAALKAKTADIFNVAPDAPSDQAKVYTLDGEILEWHKGNTAERLLLAAGSIAGRENAKIHYWIVDKTGKKVFENTDTIRQGMMSNTHEKNSGTLTLPFTDKITERVKEAKIVP
jgi:hypothetical protein